MRLTLHERPPIINKPRSHGAFSCTCSRDIYAFVTLKALALAQALQVAAVGATVCPSGACTAHGPDGLCRHCRDFNESRGPHRRIVEERSGHIIVGSQSPLTPNGVPRRPSG